MRICLVSMMALCLTACGEKPADQAATKKPAAQATRPVAASDDAVAAVIDSQGTPVAQLRFVIDSRPVAGKPFRLQLIASAADAVQLQLSTQSDNLVVDPAALALDLQDSGGAGSNHFVATQDFMVLARQEGLFELFVHLTADTAGPDTVYSVPVLVAKSDTAAAPSDKADPAAKGDHG